MLDARTLRLACPLFVALCFSACDKDDDLVAAAEDRPGTEAAADRAADATLGRWLAQAPWVGTDVSWSNVFITNYEEIEHDIAFTASGEEDEAYTGAAAWTIDYVDRGERHVFEGTYEVLDATISPATADSLALRGTLAITDAAGGTSSQSLVVGFYGEYDDAGEFGDYIRWVGAWGDDDVEFYYLR